MYESRFKSQVGVPHTRYLTGSRTVSYVSEDAFIRAEKHFSANAVSRAAFGKLDANATNTTIPVYFHIISSDLTIDGGNIS